MSEHVSCFLAGYREIGCLYVPETVMREKDDDIRLSPESYVRLVKREPFPSRQLDHELSPLFEHSCHFFHCGIRVLEMFEHVVQQDTVKGAIQEWKSACICTQASVPPADTAGYIIHLTVKAHCITVYLKELADTGTDVEYLPVKKAAYRQEK